MKGDTVCRNGVIMPLAEAVGDPDGMFAVNFVYQKMHVSQYRVLHGDLHCEIATTSFGALYGADAGLSAELLDREAELLLRANRYPPASNQVMLYLLPEGGDAPAVRLLSCEKQLLYKGYAMRPQGIRTLITPYDIPFSQHKTAVSLAAHTYAAAYARRREADEAIRENGEGVLTGVGENPLFVVMRDMVVTTPVEEGAAESVERRLVIEACHRAGVKITEAPLTEGMLADADELFTATPQGISGIYSCRFGSGERTFPHSMARHVASHMK